MGAEGRPTLVLFPKKLHTKHSPPGCRSPDTQAADRPTLSEIFENCIENPLTIIKHPLKIIKHQLKIIKIQLKIIQHLLAIMENLL